MTDVMERVMAGYEWLTSHGERFGCDVDRVDLESLDMRATTACVLGQAYESADPGEFWPGYTCVLNAVCAASGHGQTDWTFRDGWAHEHGFYLLGIGMDGGESQSAYDTLAAAWRDVISAARARRESK